MGSALIGGCSNTAAPPGQHRLQVQVRAAAASASAAMSAMGAPASESILVEVEEAVLVLGGLKLETAGLDGTVDWVLEESVVVPLDLGGHPTLAFDTDVPAGTYKELEVSVDKLELGHPDEQTLIDEWPPLADASVLVSGRVVRNGASEPFTFSAPIDVDLELAFGTPLQIEDGDVEVMVVSLDIEHGSWFESPAAAALDPTDPAARSDIVAAIERSMSVLQRS